MLLIDALGALSCVSMALETKPHHDHSNHSELDYSQLSLPWASCPLDEENSTISECEDSSETQYFWFRTVLDSTSRIGKTADRQ